MSGRLKKATAALPIERDASLLVEFERDHPSSGRVVVTEGYHRALNPSTGIEAVFIEGETVPDWALSDDDRSALGINGTPEEAEHL